MKYSTYPLSLETTARKARKARVVPKNLSGKALIGQSARFLYEMAPQMLHAMDFLVHSEEWHWLNSEKLVYYPGSLDVAQSLMSASFSARDEAAFFSGFESFILAFPAGVQFAGKPALGCLITICIHKERQMKFLTKFGKVIGIEKMTINGRQVGGEGYTISINYPDHAVKMGIVRMCLSSDMLAGVLACQSVEEHVEHMAKINEFQYKGNITLSDIDHAYQYELTRFVLRFLMYKKALPERIMDGLPGVGRKEVETPHAMNRTHKIINAPKANKDSPAAHYRSWHFRQLSHERYYKGEYESWSPGSRVIFVSDSYVGQKVTPMTVT